MDPNKVRPRRDWVLVLNDRRKEQLASGLFLPVGETGVEKVTEGAGTVIRIGPGVKNDKLNLLEGDRIVYRSFLRFASKVEAEEYWAQGVQKEYFLMAADDIMGIVAPGVEVGVFSGRPAVTGKVE